MAIIKKINLDYNSEIDEVLNQARNDLGGGPIPPNPGYINPPQPKPRSQPKREEYHDFDNNGTPPPNQSYEEEGNTYGGQDEYEDYGGYEEDGGQYYRGGGGILSTGIKLAGVLAILLMIFIGIKSITNINYKKNKELENFVKMNPTGGYYESTPGDVFAENQGNTEGGLGGIDTSTLETEIMKYTKKTALDNRPMLTLESDNYGTFDIYIPYQKYTEMDNKGFILVDAEVVNGKVTFLYISSKQDNLNELLNKNN